MTFKIGLLGLGTVGAGTASILLSPEGRHHLLKDVVIHRVGVRDLQKPRPIEISEDLLTTDLQSIVNDPEIDIIVEVMGGLEPARSLILQSIEQGKHIVTANKAVIARYGHEIFTKANEKGVHVLLEASVGGGIPIIKPLKQDLGVNRIQRVIGIINGTTNYILTQMTQKGADFGEVLAQAQALGYAEADPTADVDGWDAGDKIAILASLAFGERIKREDIYTEGIRKVTSADIGYADKLGFIIKLLGIAERGKIGGELQVRVHPTLVAKNHPLASINGVFNAILVEGDPLGQVMFYGPGAGAGATASAVVSDIVNIVAYLKITQPHQSLAPLLSCSHEYYAQLGSIDSLESRFYCRFLTRDLPGVIGHLGMAFGDNHVSLESIVQIGFQEDLAEIVVVTHTVQEGDFRKALKEIEQLESVASIPSVLRVL